MAAKKKSKKKIVAKKKAKASVVRDPRKVGAKPKPVMRKTPELERLHVEGNDLAPVAEARIVDLEMKLGVAEQALNEEKEAHEATKAKLRDALRGDGPASSSEPHERGPAKLGFRRVDGVPVPDEDERKLVKIAVRLREHVGGSEAARKLNDKGVLLRGKEWTASKLVWAANAAASWDA